jgi:hypothetical protein
MQSDLLGRGVPELTRTGCDETVPLAMPGGTGRRGAGVAGVLFVALTIAAVATGPNLDLTQADYARRLQSFYAVSANQSRSSISFSLGVLAVLSFILFLGSLWDALREAGGEEDQPSAAIIVAGGAFATLFAVGWALGGMAGFALREVQTYKPDVDSFLLLGWLAILSRVAALAAAGTMAAAAAPAVRKAFAPWVSTLGYLVAVLGIAAVVFLWVAPLGLIVDGAAFVGFLIWSAAIALAMSRVIGQRS